MKTAILVSTTGPRHCCGGRQGSVVCWDLPLEFLDPPWDPGHDLGSADAQDCSELSPPQNKPGWDFLAGFTG